MFKVSSSSILSMSENEPLLNNQAGGIWSKNCRDGFLRAIDLLITAFIATPLTVTYWIATWNLFTIYIFENDLILSCLITGALANFLLWIFYLAQNSLQQFHDSISDASVSRLLFKILFRILFTYFNSLGNFN